MASNTSAYEKHVENSLQMVQRVSITFQVLLSIQRRLAYHADCKVEFQPLKWSNQQLTRLFKALKHFKGVSKVGAQDSLHLLHQQKEELQYVHSRIHHIYAQLFR